MGATSAMLGGVAPSVMSQSGPSNPMSPRQIELDRLWRHYRCATYDDRGYDWNGREIGGSEASAAIGTSQYMPGGFYDAGQDLPLTARRPNAPYYLGRVIVDRFTGLLFSERRHPKLSCPEDTRTEAWITAVAKSMRIWQRMVLARSYGGAMGSHALGFRFEAGVPKLEIHDPRWCTPLFSDRSELVVRRFEKLYQYPADTRDEDGNWVQGWFWYRRVIDAQTDTVWSDIPVEDEEPLWGDIKGVEVKHGYGFCPIVWVQNTEIEDSIDGDPDCHGIFDTIEEIDALVAQSNRGIKANCDPTPVITTDKENDGDIRKGSSNAIMLEKGGSASYMELSGSGPAAAKEQATFLEKQALRIARCVLDDNFSGPARTEEETEQNYSNMLERADTMREQYGERGIKRLLEMVIRAARGLATTTKLTVVGSKVTPARSIVRLPLSPEGKPYELGNGTTIDLIWPDYYEPSLDRVTKAVDAASKAEMAWLINKKLAVQFIAPFFKVEDVAGLVEELAPTPAVDPAAAYTEPTSTEEVAPEEEAPEAADAPQAADVALTGVQITAQIEVSKAVFAGEMDAEAGVAILLNSFPDMDEREARRIAGQPRDQAAAPVETPDPAQAPPTPEE